MNHSEGTSAQTRMPPSVCHGQDFHVISSASALYSKSGCGAVSTGLMGMRVVMHCKIFTECLAYSGHSINVLKT